MERHRKILEYALSSLIRKKFKNLAILAVFSFLIMLIASILLFTHAFKTEAVNTLSGAPELIVQRVVGGRHALIPLRYGEEIRSIPGAGTVLPRYWGYYYDTSTGANYTIQGFDAVLSGTLTMVEGSLAGKNMNGTCIIGKGVSDSRIVGTGGILPLKDSDGHIRNFTVSGIFNASSTILTNDLIIVSPEDAQRLFAIPQGFATDILVQVFNPEEVANIAGKIKNRFPDSRPITRGEIIRTYDSLFNWRSGLILTMFLGALIAFCILAWDKATGLSAEERREIGILKAVGWETSDILELKFWEGTAVSLFSFLTGFIAAYLHVFFFNASLFAPALKGWSVLFPDFHLVPYISMYQIFVLLFLTVVPYIASTIIPSWKASITDPDIVMRG